MRFPLQGIVTSETSYISFDDSALAYARLGSLDSRAPLARRVRFAAQIARRRGVAHLYLSSVARQGEGGCPVTEFSSFLSFQSAVV